MSRTEKFQSPEVRGIWTSLFNPKTTDYDNKPLERPRFELTMLIPKLAASWDQDQNFLFFHAQVNAIVAADFGGQYPSEHFPIKDGDVKAAADAKYAYLAGHWYISTSSTYKPVCADANRNEIPMPMVGHPDPIKSGDYVVCSIDCYGYNNRTKGVAFGLEGVMKTRDGEPIGNSGGRPVSDIFGAPTGAPAAAPIAAAAPGYAPPAAAPVYAAPAAAAAPVYAAPAAAAAPVYAAPAAAAAPVYAAPAPAAAPVYAAPAPAAPLVGQPVGVAAPAASAPVQQMAPIASPSSPAYAAPLPAAPLAAAPVPAGPPVPGYAPPVAAAAPVAAAPGMPPIGGH